jgi:SOS response regulatory protein OraA/RecX
MVHKEDNGLVFCSIRNDGMIIYWCEKCGKIWLSKAQPESEIPREEQENARAATELIRKRFIVGMIKDYKEHINDEH